MSTNTSIMSPDVLVRLAELENWRYAISQLRIPELAPRSNIAVNGPCRLTKQELRKGEILEFRNKRVKSRNRNKMAKASRKR